ncbi:hydroxyacid oxidase 1-like [Lytechinus variegatus]|uniref:hydroxyacid oxidase 1-like n=1 Tax=Lytechinus variegatus TaxID=7654 RepID=UPI001BB25455|nr:hydroxyacid oxidase 1-like [Lytechinus variegatus]
MLYLSLHGTSSFNMSDVLDKPRNIQQYEDGAQKVLPPSYFRHYNYPGPAGQTYTDNKAAFKRYRFRPHLLNDVSTRHLSTSLLGETVSIPIGIAPTATQRFAHKDAEVGMAKGAEAVGGLMIRSSYANKFLKEIRASAPGVVLWQNVYIWKDRRYTKALIRKAEEAGCKALVITVDSPSTGVDTSDFYRNYMIYNHEECRQSEIDLDLEEQQEAKKRGDPNLIMFFTALKDPSITWKDITWVKSLTSLPIVCKGILTAEAATQAVNAGADGIIVSSHGGRQLDGVPAPIDALAEVVEAVRGRNVEVYMDGGIRNGTDVLKALARGAKAVFVGRPALWGLACGGASGVENVLRILRNELDFAMSLCGCPDVNNLPKDIVVHESFYHSPKHKL